MLHDPTRSTKNDPNNFVCAICFRTLDISQCVLVDGDKIDICVECIEMEKHFIKEE